MEIVLSRHARFRMAERGISASEVREAVLKGTKRLQGERVVVSYRYFDAVYRREGETILVITVMSRW